MKAALILSVLTLLFFVSSAQRTIVQVDYKKGFNNETDSILKVAVRLLDSVINSDKFAEKVHAATFKRNKDSSNDAILQLIRSGKEDDKADYIVNLKLEVYYDYAGGSEVGNTTADNITHTYQEYITKNGAACYAAHIAHEYCHVLGFTHPKFHFLGNVKASSVPYVIGDIVAEILGAECP